MANNTYQEEDKRIKYSKFLSSLFSSMAIIVLSILCLLNNLSFDLYSSICLFKVVIPAAFCFWFLGFVMGKKLDELNVAIVTKEVVNSKKAYEIPSMFAADIPEGETTENLELFNDQ